MASRPEEKPAGKDQDGEQSIQRPCAEELVAKAQHGAVDPGHTGNGALMEDKENGALASDTPRAPSCHDSHQTHDPESPSTRRRLDDLPPEMLYLIMSHLAPWDLATISATSKPLRQLATADHIWHHRVQEHVPGLTIKTPGQYASYMSLYAAYDRQWFLPHYKLWFCDHDLTGRLILVRFDPRRTCIEGYQLLALNWSKMVREPWLEDPDVVIHGFEPDMKLHLDRPILRFQAQDVTWDGGFSQRPEANRFSDEIPMTLEDRRDGRFSNFLLACALGPVTIEKKATKRYPYDSLWPPPPVPATQRISGSLVSLGMYELGELGAQDRPRKRSEVSLHTFRIRQWMEMGGSPSMSEPYRDPVSDLMRFVAVARGDASRGVRLGEEFVSYSTLDPSVYTPTRYKPWRGIWVGDYSSHGCEFILVHQPDDDPPASDAELGLVRSEFESNSEWESRRTDARVYRGKLEGIKLTGDPNVPRGERTFVADDLGPGGYIASATEAPFSGARIVRSKGHVALPGFRDDTYIHTRLFLVSHDVLAQHWVEFKHISYFRRVDVDSFLRV